MAGNAEVSLPPSVEAMMAKICEEQNQPPLRTDTRRDLASISEEDALSILHTISRLKIKISFDGLVTKFVNQLKNCCFSPPPSNKRPKICPEQQNRSSPNITPTRLMMPSLSSSSSPIKPTRLMMSPQSDFEPTRPMMYPSSSNSSPIKPTRLMMSPQRTYYGDFAVQSPNEPLKPRSSKTPDSESACGSAAISPLEALEELEYRKSFLILSYIGGRSLEDVVSSDQIRALKDLPTDVFEQQIWQAFGCQCGYIKEEDRVKHLDLDPEQTQVYHCHVYSDGSYRFKGPYPTSEQNLLQRTLGDDNVLMVKFEEEETDKRCPERNTGYHYYLKYRKILKEGILVGQRRYRFFGEYRLLFMNDFCTVFKDSRKKKDPNTSPVKCFFVRFESSATIDNKDYVLTGKTVREARSHFMHVYNLPTLAKFMARFSLILSNTINLEVDLSSVNIETIPDEQCRDNDGNVVYDKDGKILIHTDGTGFISEDLALKCPKNVFKGKKLLGTSKCKERFLQSRREEPVRLFENGRAVKGTLLVNKKLPPQTIQVRPSMIKVEKDPELLNTFTMSSLEICGTSNRPKKTYLSRYLIALLTYGGVPEKFFMDIVDNVLEETRNVLSDPSEAWKVASRYGWTDDKILTEMIQCGIPLEESYLQYRLSRLTSTLMVEERKSLKMGKLPVTESYYLMGTVDPTGILESNEVCVILDNGHLSGDVLVYRNPGSHFGDIHVLKARYVKELGDFVGHAKYAILFPCKGPRSLADQMAGGDYDGDMFFVSTNPLLLATFKQSKPGPSSSTDNAPNKKTSPSALSREELEEELFKLFFNTRFQPSYTVGVAADSWVVTIDQLLTLGHDCEKERESLEKKILQLIDIYNDALDAPKNGRTEIKVPERLKAKQFPHYMEKKASYHSNSILGLIYDRVTAYEEMDQPNFEVRKLPLFDKQVRKSCLVRWDRMDTCLEEWRRRYEGYRNEMSVALKDASEKSKKNEGANKVRAKYKETLYGAAEYYVRERHWKDIFDEAVAIYNVCYEYADAIKDVKKCNFAWNIAGPALCQLYWMEHHPDGDGDSLQNSSLSAMRRIFQSRKRN